MNEVERRSPLGVTRLVGRDEDLSFIRSFFHDSVVRGAALLLTGEAGVGKTALLDVLAQDAVRRGGRVLRARGVQFEADIGYAGLNQLLVPLFDEFGVLDEGHREALRVAVGIGSGPSPDRLLTSTAVLLLLRLISRDTPLLVVVDDLPWLDRATTGVLGFVARRLVGSKVGLVAACRSGADSFFESSGLTEHRLGPLDEMASAELVALAHPDVSPAVRRRIVAEAHGNPLALVELPDALSGEQRTTLTAVPAVLPLSERLQAMFVSRVAGLPAPTRELLLFAALDGTGDLAPVEGAVRGRAVFDGLAPAARERLVFDDLAPAERERLVVVSADTRKLSFRHPLIGSAVVAQATTAERHRAHRALAAALGDRPERRAWHLGEVTVGPDEEVAGLLEQAARLRMRRGDALGAVMALTRAAGLSPLPADKSRRLAEAAYIGTDAGGELAGASRLLDDARQADPSGRDSLHAAAAAAFLLINKDGDVGTAHGLLVGAIENGDHGYRASDDALVDALHSLVLLCWYGGDPRLWEPLFRALDRLTPAPPDLLWTVARTFGDPARTGPEGLARLDVLLARVGDDPTRVVRLGTASVYPDRLARVREASLRLVEHGRSGGAPVRRYLGALMHLGLDSYNLGRWDDAMRLAGEGIALGEEHGYHFFDWELRYVQALVAAARGEVGTSDALVADILRWANPRGAHGARYFAAHAQALGALGSGDFEAAFRHASVVSAPGVLAPFVPHALWSAMDLVEAALRTGRTAEAEAHATAMRESAMSGLSPRLGMLVLACEALTARGEEALVLFERALSSVEVEKWPFDVARVRLFHGEHLRRRRATREARGQLVAALESFEALGAAPWVARATAELRATGYAGPAIAPARSVSLTAQELHIAELAAGGLTNKQIGERLFLSHRTVGAHLYQIYPKLGIVSRAALRDALESLPKEGGGR
ncbi:MULTISPECIES: ATP-binding protein [unclassified Streptomyces]|uniref:ATP-binding protein n=1 Tax=unclassified Streptomyces TaxID=2593676 RepID=UPI0016609D4A|nr:MULTISPECIES: LuxR family transcriptional regulator [unclassified Streptomyces]MBD0710926.1 LuxR family transcriptional regulator [Streptomyces sp. CBMA291]MBD0717345.1 LuxR family transcriptional regulator [Streptomyces sp. CBMA370]